MPRIRLQIPESLAEALEADARGCGLPASMLVRTDLVRYRALSQAAVPPLSEWEWKLLSQLLSGTDAQRILNGDDSLPSGSSIARELDRLPGGATPERIKIDELRRMAMEWSPLAVAGILMRVRRT
jgi:hypothetical protein